MIETGTGRFHYERSLHVVMTDLIRNPELPDSFLHGNDRPDNADSLRSLMRTAICHDEVGMACQDVSDSLVPVRIILVWRKTEPA